MFIFACFNLFAIIMFMVKFVWDVEENRLLALRGVNKMFDICHLPRLNVKEYMRQYGDDTDTDTDTDTDADTDDEDNAVDNNNNNNKDTDDTDDEHEHDTNTEAVTQMINDYKEYKKDESFSQFFKEYIVYKQDIVERTKIVEDYEDEDEDEEANDNINVIMPSVNETKMSTRSRRKIID